MSTDIVRFDDDQINGMTRYAKAYSGSEFFKDKGSIEKAFVAISAGAEIGVQPFAAITGISIIQGKPVIGAGILAGLVKSHPKYDYRVKQLDDEACVIDFLQDGVSIGESSFTMADAKRAGLAGKDVWKNYPRNMLFARAISNGVAFFTPDVTTTRMYVEHELDEIEPAPARRKRSEQAVVPTREIVVDVDPVPAAPAAPTAAETPEDPPEDEPAAGTSIPEQTEAAKLVMKAMSAKQREVVKEACAHINVPWDAATPFRLVQLYGADATTRDTLLARLVENVSVVPNPYPAEGTAEGEVPFPDTDAEAAERFQTHLDAEREAAADENIAGANKARDRISEKLAAAGNYGGES